MRNGDDDMTGLEEERVKQVTAALIGPYVGMRFILRKAELIAMRDFEGCLCEAISEMSPIAEHERAFCFKIIDGPLAKTAPPRNIGWVCWNNKCWEKSIVL